MELLIIIVQELDFPRLSSAFIHNHVGSAAVILGVLTGLS